MLRLQIRTPATPRPPTTILFSLQRHRVLSRKKTLLPRAGGFHFLPLRRPTLPPLLLSHDKYLLQLEPYLRSQWRFVVKGWLCGALSVLCLSSSVSRLSLLTSAPSRAAPPLLALAFLQRVASYLHQVFLWEASLAAVRDLRSDVFSVVLQRDMSFFEGPSALSPGDVAHRITAETSQIADTLFSLLSVIVPDLLQLIAMASRMVAVSPVLSLASVAVIPFLTLTIACLGETLCHISKRAHESVARISAYLIEVLQSILIVKSYNGEVKESLRLQRLANEDFKCLLEKRKMKALIPQFVQFLYMGALVLLWFGSVLASGGSYNFANMVSFVTSLALLVEPIKGLGKVYNELKQGEPAVERLFGLTKLSAQVCDRPDAIGMESVEGDIKFCNVSFRYTENTPFIFNEISLHIRPRETVAIVGPSGGGKTTLTKLLLRFYDPLSGYICLDNQDTRKLQLRSLRKHIGYVPQDMVIFAGTIAENIAYKNSLGKIDMERVVDAAKSANADEFIRTLPDGYETDVGSRGSRLSGGQRQRLAIARALYHESSILILDEATSALDIRSELLVREALRRLMVDHTILIIAHRIETVLMADRIIFLEGGRLEEISQSVFLARNGHSSAPSETHVS